MRRQTIRATSTGSPGGPADSTSSGSPGAAGRRGRGTGAVLSEIDRRRHHVDRCALVDASADAQLLLDLLLDLVGEVGVVAQEVADVLLALPELIGLVGVPGAGLLHDPLLDADIDQRALTADALAVHDVELGLLERRRDLVLHDLHPGAVTDRVATVLQRLDAPDVEA